MEQVNNKDTLPKSKTTTIVAEKEEQMLSAKDLAKQKLNMFSNSVLSDFTLDKSTHQIQKKTQQTVTPSESTVAESKPKEQPKEEAIIESKVSEQETNKEISKPQENTLFSVIEEVESTGEELITGEINSLSKKSPKSMKFRTRLMTGVFCVLVAIFSGWIIGNAVDIANTYSSIGTEQALKNEYNVKIADYLLKISQLDDYNQSNPNRDGALLPIEEIIPIVPQPLEDPTSYEKESNWFDKICNWISNIFGG